MKEYTQEKIPTRKLFNSVVIFKIFFCHKYVFYLSSCPWCRYSCKSNDTLYLHKKFKHKEEMEKKKFGKD